MELLRITYCCISALLLAALLAAGCATKQNNVRKDPKPEPTAALKKIPVEKTGPDKVDVPILANRSADHFDKIFGSPSKISPVRNNRRLMPGEYREYRIDGHPKGLSVRFHRDKAKRFNLLLGEPEDSAKKALASIFNIDVNKLTGLKSDPLSETWKGRYDGVEFETAYAKRGKSSGDFIMLHAEVGE